MSQLAFNFDVPDRAPRLAPVEHMAAPARNRRRPPPFNYTDALCDVLRDIVGTLDELRHVDLSRVLVAVRQARQATQHGTYASCTPLRFKGGVSEMTVRRRTYRILPVVHQGREMLYVLNFVLPRFHQEQDYHGKLATIIHELYHISPDFNGDIRRFPGKNYAHGQSREVYHAAMCRLADQYLARSPKAREHLFLRYPFAELLKWPGGVVGARVPKPKIVRVEERAAT